MIKQNKSLEKAGVLQYTLKSVSELTANRRNARTHSKSQIKKIANSIKEFGFISPAIIDKDGVLVAGHGRLEAAKSLGMTEIPCLIADHLTPEQLRAYMLADNRIQLDSGGGWDEEILKVELGELSDIGFNIDLTGFDISEVEGHLRHKGFVEGEDDVPETPENPVSKLGDIWILGEHRVMCGDSTNFEQVEKLMNGQKADMVFTDPPYRMQVEGGLNQPIGRAAVRLGEEIKHLCDFDPVAFLEILLSVFKKNTQNSYVFCNKDLVPDYLNWGIKNGFSFNILVWKKPNAIPLGGNHRPDIEYLLLFRKSAHWNNAVPNVDYSKCLSFDRENSTPHPTMKPVGLIENEVKISSNSGHLVLDLFGGSGSTLIACEKTKRNCLMMELDPKYCDVIVKRWQDFTGRTAILEATGEPYPEKELKAISEA